MTQHQIQKQVQATKQDEPETQAESVPDIKDEGLAEDVDAILDEIDEVLEENAAEFVRSFIQKGGE